MARPPQLNPPPATLTAPNGAPAAAATASGRPRPRFFEVGADRVQLLCDGETAFPEILAAIAAAAEEILVEMYWFAADRVGRRMRDALAAAAARGVTVRVIYDAFGSIAATERFWKPLTDSPNGSVRLYGALAPWQRRFKLGRLLHRDHRKLIVIDGRRAFVGGLNIGEEWWPPDGRRGWRDDLITLVGPTAREARSLFWHTWRRLGGRVPAGVSPIPAEGNGLVWLIANSRRFGAYREIRRTYLQQIRRARRSIDIANAYFLPDRKVRRALWAARRRGVPIRILLPEKSDLRAFALAQRALVPKLVKAGIAVFAYRPAVFHSKTAVIDDFVTIGSYNLDHRSWRFNLECNLAVFDRTFAAAVRENFERDLSDAAPQTATRVAGGFIQRFAAGLLYRLRFLL